MEELIIMDEYKSHKVGKRKMVKVTALRRNVRLERNGYWGVP